MKKVKNNLILVINIILIILSFTLLLNVYSNHFFNEKETTVPNLIKLDQKDAIKLLKNNKLKYRIVEGKANEFDNNQVFSQYPKPNSKVKINRIVEIWVNTQDTFSLPNLVGKSLTDARIFLNNLNINISRIDYVPSDKYSEETVLATYPKSDSKVSDGGKVALLVSSKSLLNTNTMPNLIGLELKEANNILANIRQSVQIISEANDPSFAKNVIIATNPLPGEALEADTKIAVVLNTGLELDKSIDDIIDEKKLTEEEIEKILNDTLKNLDEKKKGETK